MRAPAMYTQTFVPVPGLATRHPPAALPAEPVGDPGATLSRAPDVLPCGSQARAPGASSAARRDAAGSAASGARRMSRLATAARRRLRRNDDGAAMVEFGFLAPVFIAMICAILEFSGIMFVQALLEGSAGEASRYGITGYTLPGVTREAKILAIINDNTYGIVDMDKLEIETLVYENFSDIGQPEPFEDENGNGAWDSGEPFTDVNGNGKWDPDMGAAGLGGPGAVVVYRLRYDWPIMIPLFRPFFGESIPLQANIAVRNEPFTPSAGA